jgi:hypothetical protein
MSTQVLTHHALTERFFMCFKFHDPHTAPVSALIVGVAMTLLTPLQVQASDRAIQATTFPPTRSTSRPPCV